jgi:hypothetical protein
MKKKNRKVVWVVLCIFIILLCIIACGESQHQKSKGIEEQFLATFVEGIMGCRISYWGQGEGYRVVIFLEEPFSIETFWEASEKFTELLQNEIDNGFNVRHMEIILTESNERILFWETEVNNLSNGTLNNIVSGNTYHVAVADLREFIEAMDNAPFDGFLQNVINALTFNLGIADGKFTRPTSLSESFELYQVGDTDSVGEYHGLVGSLAGYRVTAFLDRTNVQDYRTMYYTLHWKNAYIEEFGEDSYMIEAERYIANIISTSDIQRLNTLFGATQTSASELVSIEDLTVIEKQPKKEMSIIQGLELNYGVAPDIIFTTTAEENGLGDVLMFIEGIFHSHGELDGFDLLFIDTVNGMMVFLFSVDLFDDSVEKGELTLPILIDILEVDKEYGFFFLYSGFSGVYEMPSGWLIGLDY